MWDRMQQMLILIVFLFIFYYCETIKKAPGFDILLSKHTGQANVGSQMRG